MSFRSRLRTVAVVAIACCASLAPAAATYVNFESSHVHPLALTPDGSTLLAVNTPDALLELFSVEPDGSLTPSGTIAVGLEPVGVVVRSNTEAFVVNNASDSVSLVDLSLGVVTRTLQVGDEPTDAAIAAGRLFVAVSSEDVVRSWPLANLDAAPTTTPLDGRDVRALAVSLDGTEVYAVVLKSGNGTTVVNASEVWNTGNPMDENGRLAAMGLSDLSCDGPPPSYPPLPPGVTRNSSLPTPQGGGDPLVSLIVGWDEVDGRWEDETGTSWDHCVGFEPADRDLFVIDAATATVVDSVRGLGTSLFEVSVRPGSGTIWVPHTEARNRVRFEHPLGVQGHVVDNRFAVVDPSNGNALTQIDLNTHIDRASDPATNLAEREASVSQPGMMTWSSDGSVGWLTAIGSRRVFRVDGGCAAGACVFGADRTAPAAVVTGEGPTGVALNEAAGRLYVLNRISHDVAVVDTSALAVVQQQPLHDPSSENTRLGRRFLYDAIDTSAHGDAACSSCHVSGDLDGLAWDLGDPSGEFAPYSRQYDNVRFFSLFTGDDCTPDGQGACSSQLGFDPQKGPMTTQTLRGMLEPLHWRGDRATMNEFNKAFVGLMGTEDIGPVNGEPAGLSAADMELFRQFSLEIAYPSNPHRNVDDTLPNANVLPHGALLPGNPTVGADLFDNGQTDGNGPCVTCHTHPFGAGGGRLGGVDPSEGPANGSPADAAMLFSGNLDQSFHSDVKISHLRNMYDKFGPVWADTSAPGPRPQSASLVGYAHDGSIPDMFRFFSITVFSMTAQQVRDATSFMFHFPTGTKPAIGRMVTVPAGAAPTGSAADEALLATLIGVGDAASGSRHCELVAATLRDGRQRRYALDSGVWRQDAAADSPISTAALREGAQGPVTFMCATLDAGPRLGGDRDLDLTLDGDDCAPGDATSWGEAEVVSSLSVDGSSSTALDWPAQGGVGPGVRYEVLGGTLAALRTSGIAAAGCVSGPLATTSYVDAEPDPAPGEGRFWVVRATNGCGPGSAGAGREVLEALDCP